MTDLLKGVVLGAALVLALVLLVLVALYRAAVAWQRDEIEEFWKGPRSE